MANRNWYKGQICIVEFTSDKDEITGELRDRFVGYEVIDQVWEHHAGVHTFDPLGRPDAYKWDGLGTGFGGEKYRLRPANTYECQGYPSYVAQMKLGRETEAAAAVVGIKAWEWEKVSPESILKIWAYIKENR